jgi:hypothetical protein
MQVQHFERDCLTESAAGRSPLDAERGPHRRLPDGDRGILPDVTERLAQADRRRRLSLAERCGGDRRDYDVFRFRAVLEFLDRLEIDLCDVITVQFGQPWRDADILGDLGNGLERGLRAISSAVSIAVDLRRSYACCRFCRRLLSQPRPCGNGPATKFTCRYSAARNIEHLRT